MQVDKIIDKIYKNTEYFSKIKNVIKINKSLGRGSEDEVGYEVGQECKQVSQVGIRINKS